MAETKIDNVPDAIRGLNTRIRIQMNIISVLSTVLLFSILGIVLLFLLAFQLVHPEQLRQLFHNTLIVLSVAGGSFLSLFFLVQKMFRLILGKSKLSWFEKT